MKKIFLVHLFAIFSQILSAQPSTATWKIEHKNADDGSVDLIFTADIEAKWYIYSVQKTEGPQPTSVTLNGSVDYEPVGELQEGLASKQKFDDAFEVNVNYFEGKAVFV